MKKYAIVVAGGKGLRMGGEIPKQFIPVQGRPVLMRTLDAFHAYDESVELIVVLPVAQQDYWKELCREYDFRIPYRLADGGETLSFRGQRSGRGAGWGNGCFGGRARRCTSFCVS